MKKRILIVDDESGFLKMLKLNLENRGPYLVIEETDPLQAISTARKTRPDIIFLDIMMPGLDGGEVANRLRADRSLQQVPVVFLTAIASKSEAAGNHSTGGIPILAKPVTADELIACIEENLNR